MKPQSRAYAEMKHPYDGEVRILEAQKAWEDGYRQALADAANAYADCARQYQSLGKTVSEDLMDFASEAIRALGDEVQS